jgi:hypothetical protein
MSFSVVIDGLPNGTIARPTPTKRWTPNTSHPYTISYVPPPPARRHPRVRGRRALRQFQPRGRGIGDDPGRRQLSDQAAGGAARRALCSSRQRPRHRADRSRPPHRAAGAARPSSTIDKAFAVGARRERQRSSASPRRAPSPPTGSPGKLGSFQHCSAPISPCGCDVTDEMVDLAMRANSMSAIRGMPAPSGGLPGLNGAFPHAHAGDRR